MLAGRRVAWCAQGWRALPAAPAGVASAVASAGALPGAEEACELRRPAGRRHLPEEACELRWGTGRHGALVAQHAGALTLPAQRQALAQVRSRVLAAADGRDPTAHLHARTLAGAETVLMVLRFLHDLEDRVERAHGSPEDDGRATCGWTPQELFCRPWVLTRGKAWGSSSDVLRLEEHVPAASRALCAAVFPFGVPIGSLLAWVTVQSPGAFCKLHARRIAGPRLRPFRVRLAEHYRVDAPGLGPDALAQAAAAGEWRPLVHGGVPEVLLS